MKLVRYLFMALMAWSAVSCAGRRAPSPEAFDRILYAPAHAAGFEIAGAEGMRSTLLRIRNPWQGAEGVEATVFLRRDGEPVPEGFDGQVVEAGAERIVCMSSSYVAMLDAVGGVERIVGVSGPENIVNPYVAAHRDRIGDVGFDAAVDYERLVALAPDVVLLYGMHGASGMESRLRELGIPFVYIGDYLEESPLGKAEWVVAIAELIDRRDAGERFFAPIPARYEALRRRVAGRQPRPGVMINTPYAGSWFMASASSYVARLIADAGGEYLYTKNTANRSLPVDLEEAYRLVAAADVWINAGGVGTLDALCRRYPKFADARCVRSGRVYDNDARRSAAGGNDYWESGVVRPDVVLHDLISIFHPDALAPDDRTLYYYRRLE